MSGTPGHPMSRRRIAEALADLIDDRGVRDVADQIGATKSTVHRRGDSLDRWPALDLLSLCIDSPSLWAAVVTYVEGDATQCDPATLMTQLLAMGAADMDEAKLVMEAIADGRVDRMEARRLLEEWNTREADRASVRRHLENIAAGGGS